MLIEQEGVNSGGCSVPNPKRQDKKGESRVLNNLDQGKRTGRRETLVSRELGFQAAKVKPGGMGGGGGGGGKRSRVTQKGEEDLDVNGGHTMPRTEERRVTSWGKDVLGKEEGAETGSMIEKIVR